MAQIRKISQQLEIKSNGDIHFQVFKHKLHEISKMSPRVAKSCELVEGEWGTVGSIIKWSYHHDGKVITCKDVITAIDNKKRSITFKVIEGDILMLFNSFQFVLEINKNGTNESLSWTLEYEKTSENVADPEGLMDLLMVMTKDIDTYHLN